MTEILYYRNTKKLHCNISFARLRKKGLYMLKLFKWLKWVFSKESDIKDPAMESLYFPPEINDIEFNKWAFHTSMELSFSSKIHNWNKFHGELKTFTPSDNKIYVYRIMVQFWLHFKKEENENNTSDQSVFHA